MSTGPGLDEFVSGGRFLGKLAEAPDRGGKKLTPDRILSISDYLTPVIPNMWAIRWVNMPDGERFAEAAKFRLDEAAAREVIQWTTENFKQGHIGWPNVFTSAEAARGFASRFLGGADSVLLWGIGLHESLVKTFLDFGRPSGNVGEPGVYACIRHGLKLDPEGELLGREIACYDHGSFDSWFVNHLEKNLAEKGIRPGRYGLVENFGQALEGAAYCGRDDIGSEPGLWQPWAVVGYRL